MPLIVQSDHTLLLEVDNPHFAAARDDLLAFAELVRSPEHVHTYRLSPLSLWNAAASGIGPADVLAALDRWGKFPTPDNIRTTVQDQARRFGRIELVADGRDLYLTSAEPLLLDEVWSHKSVRPHLAARVGPNRIRVHAFARGHVKQALLKVGHPVLDRAGYTPGAHLPLTLQPVTRDGDPWELRTYQQDAVEAFWGGGGPTGGSGVIVLPCGAGKTLVGIGAMARAQAQTLILCANTTSVHQWMREVIQRTGLGPDQVGEYTGAVKEIYPVTVATYQILTHRARRRRGETGAVEAGPRLQPKNAAEAEAEFPHLRLFQERDWGLVIYDEVHLLPAPVFRVTADIQARRRLGLTATLLREDGREEDVFALIGPKKFEVPWRVLEGQGWIATAVCHELRVDLPEALRPAYSVIDGAERFRLAAENPVKIELVRDLLRRHQDERVLVIGHYIDQLEAMAAALQAPLLIGQTPQREREKLFAAFRAGEVPVLIVSRVANFAIDLPDASVAIEVSGLYGSRQEEAQRLGRILRPKADGRPATFYALVSRDTVEQDYAHKRQLFLTEQGYRYIIRHAERAGEAEPASPSPTEGAAAPPDNLIPLWRIGR